MLTHDMMLLDSGIRAGNATYTVTGANTFVVPRYNSMTIELWGGGGGGATSFNGGASSYGGDGGSYAQYTVNPGVLTPGVTEYLFVGAGGAGASGNSNTNLRAGGHTQFGNSIGVTGGKAGNGQTYVGQPANTFTATNIRSGFNLIISETGGTGGLGNANGQNRTYAGGGGGGMVNDFGQGQGGTSTFGGAGGNGGDASENQPRNGSAPGGGGGATDWDGGFAAGTGGAGRIIITWS